MPRYRNDSCPPAIMTCSCRTGIMMCGEVNSTSCSHVFAISSQVCRSLSSRVMQAMSWQSAACDKY